MNTQQEKTKIINYKIRRLTRHERKNLEQKSLDWRLQRVILEREIVGKTNEMRYLQDRLEVENKKLETLREKYEKARPYAENADLIHDGGCNLKTGVLYAYPRSEKNVKYCLYCETEF